MALPRLRAHLLGDLRDHLCPPQAAAAGLSCRRRDLCQAVKGLSALQLARDLNVQYQTAFVLMHKMRQSLLDQRDETPLSGAVEIDGGYTNGHDHQRR